MRRPRLNALRTFEAAGRRLSFSLAAGELNVTQAAISQQIRQLEVDLGQPLFHRTHRRIALTTVGQSYLHAVQKALERLDTVTDQLFGAVHERAVTIRCTSSIATQWLAPHMRDFQMAYPEIDLHIRTLDREGGEAHADIEIFVSGSTDHGPDVTPLVEAVITPVAAPEYIEGDRLMRPQEILNCDLIHVVGYDDDWHRWFATHQLETTLVPRGLSADSSLFAIDAALRGDGIFLGRRPFIDGYLQSGELVEVFAQPYHLHATYFLRRQRTTADSVSGDKVAGWLNRLAKTTN